MGMRVIRSGSHRRSELFEIGIQMHLHTRSVVMICPVILNGRDTYCVLGAHLANLAGRGPRDSRGDWPSDACKPQISGRR
jgi:hypothetical protein